VIDVGLEVARIGRVVHAESVDLGQVHVQPFGPDSAEHGSIGDDPLPVSHERTDVEVLERSEVPGRDDHLVRVADSRGSGDDRIHGRACPGEDVDAVVKGERAGTAPRIGAERRLRGGCSWVAEVAADRMLPEKRLDRVVVGGRRR